MFSAFVKWNVAADANRSAHAAWRWRYRDPRTGEWVNHSDLLTTEQISALDPRAEVIPGSRVLRQTPLFPTRTSR